MSAEVVSLAEAMGTAKPAPEPSSTPPPKGIVSLQEALGTKKVAPPDNKANFFVKGAKKGFDSAKDFWTELTNDMYEQQKNAVTMMKEGSTALGEGRQPFEAMGGLGETILGALSWSLSGANAIWDEGKKYLLQAPADYTAGQISKLAPGATDKYARQHDGKQDPFVITKGDIKNTSDALVNFTDIVLQAMPFGLGAERALSKTALELIPKEMRQEIKNRPARQAAKVEGAFDDLIAEDPDAAKHVQDSIVKVVPKSQKKFEARWQKFIDASEKELNHNGVEAAKRNLEELEGRIPDISKLDRSAEVPGTQRSPEALKRAEAIAQETSKAHEQLNRPMPKAMPSESRLPPPSAWDRHTAEIQTLHAKSQDLLFDLVASEKGLGAHEVFDRIIDNATGATKAILQRIRHYIPDIQIVFEDSLSFKAKDGKEYPANGLYHANTNRIRLSSDALRSGENMTHVIIHEGVHAVTSRALLGLNTKLKGELEALLDHARAVHDRIYGPKFNAQGIQTHPGTKRPYGLTDIHEFLAEGLSNPEFQKFLMKADILGEKAGILGKGIEHLKNLWDGIVDILGRALGIDPKHMPTFNALMRKGHEVMELQKTHAGFLKQTFDAINEKLTREGKDLEKYSHASVPEGFDFTARPKAAEIAKGKIAEYWDGLIRNFVPEALSKQAKLGGAYIAKGLAGLARDDSNWVHKSQARQLWWAGNKDKARDFISRFEKGLAQRTPQLENIAKAYNNWAAKIVAQDRAAGVKSYEAIDHYLPRVFKDQEGVERYLENRFGSAWRAPGFTKERSFEYLDQALKAGFKPKFTNIEDMFLARQHASDVARMKIEIMSDLKRNGLAVEKVGQKPPGPSWHSRPAPDGKSYFVHPDVSQVLNNAFDSKSLWSMKGFTGDTFRLAMAMKNTLVPLKLFGSLFHPLHVATIHNATELARTSASLLGGKENPVKFFERFVKGSIPLYHSIADTPGGYRLLQAFKGQVKNLTHGDLESLKKIQEGGFIPELSSQYRTKAIDRFRLARAEGSATALWHAPWAVLQSLQKPIFEQWIPSLKISSYLKDAAEWEKRNPTASEQERIMAFRKISKSVDNRYGEMAYNTLFWNKWMKDIAVADTLSLGWNLGFVREYGGGLLDGGKALVKTVQGKGGQAARSGLLDKPLFTLIYTTQALAYGGLMTWAMTGKSPSGWMDYIYPKTGETGPDGKEQRVNTMFYTREFGALYKHAQNEGWITGVTETIWNKGSGLMSLATEGVRGLNEWGAQIRDPNASLVKQTEQTLAYALHEFEPIAMGAVKGELGANKETALAGLGFTATGKYVTQTPTQGRIDAIYNKTYAQKEVPFDRAAQSEDARKLKQYWETDQMDKYDKLSEEMYDKYNLTTSQWRKIERGIQRGEDPTIMKFEKFSPGDQKAMLDKMSEDERDIYLKHANKKLRREYEAPE
jgi:hypothetical protein